MIETKIINKKLNTKSIKDLIVAEETNVTLIKFTLNKNEIPDYQNFVFFIKYKNKLGEGDSVLLEKNIVENNLELTWTVDSLATSVPGRMEIQIYGSILQSGTLVKKWVSNLGIIKIGDGIVCEPITPTGPTVFEQYLSQIQDLDASALASANSAAASAANALASENAAANLAESVAQHKLDPMPHSFSHNNKNYKYGIKFNGNNLSFIYEEIL